MVPQSGSVELTINSKKTADLTAVQKTSNDTLHKEGNPQKVAKEVGCSQSAVSKHFNSKVKSVEEKGAHAAGVTAAWWVLSGKGHSKV